MKTDPIVRDHLINLLNGGHAYMTFAQAVEGFPVKYINTVFPNGNYTPWALLEHIRITQWDILDFIENPKYKEITWPDAYWPPANKKATKKDWELTIKQIDRDTEKLKKIAKNPKTDLYTKLPQGTGQTILKEILVVAEHNAYHIGEFTILRQVMRTWPRDHKE